MKHYTVHIGEKTYRIGVQALQDAEHLQVWVDGRTLEVHVQAEADVSETAGGAPTPAPASPVPAAPADTDTTATALRAPMPGVILEVNVTAGARVQRGDQLLVLEAMKMKNRIRSPRAGVVAEIFVQPGQNVNYDDPLLRYGEG